MCFDFFFLQNDLRVIITNTNFHCFVDMLEKEHTTTYYTPQFLQTNYNETFILLGKTFLNTFPFLRIVATIREFFFSNLKKIF